MNMLERKILESLFRTHYSEMMHLARTLLCDDEEAADVVQDVFARLMAVDAAPAAESTRSYLLTAVHHACMNAIRRKTLKRKVESLYPMGGGIDQQPIDKMTERFEAIQVYAGQLTEPHHSVFHLRFDNDLTLKEIAHRLGLNPNTVYKYLQQSIGKIRSQFEH